MTQGSRRKRITNLRIDEELYARFRHHYPDHGDFTSIVTKLLRKHLAELDEAQTKNPLPPSAPQEGATTDAHEQKTPNGEEKHNR